MIIDFVIIIIITVMFLAEFRKKIFYCFNPVMRILAES